MTPKKFQYFFYPPQVPSPKKTPPGLLMVPHRLGTLIKAENSRKLPEKNGQGGLPQGSRKTELKKINKFGKKTKSKSPAPVGVELRMRKIIAGHCPRLGSNSFFVRFTAVYPKSPLIKVCNNN